MRVLTCFIEKSRRVLVHLNLKNEHPDISVESIEIVSCPNDPLRRTTIVSHPGDEHGSSDKYSCDTILTDVVLSSFLNIRYQVAPKNGQGPGASSRRREAILGAI